MSEENIVSECTKAITDCPQNYINSGGSCYQYKNEAVPNCTTFVATASENFPTNQYSSKSQVENPYDCVMNCWGDNDCYACGYNKSSGECRLYSSSSTNQSKNRFSLFRSALKNDPQGDTACYFKRTSGTSKECINFVTTDKTISVNVNDRKDGNLLPKIESKYLGGSCRDYIAKHDVGSDKSNIASDMAKWCQNNKDKQVCTDFCNETNYSSYCNPPFPSSIIVFTVLFFISLFGVFIIYKKHPNKKTLEFGLPIVALFFILTIYKSISYATKSKGGFTGNKPDYPQNIDVDSLCTKTPGKCGGVSGCSFSSINKTTSLWDGFFSRKDNKWYAIGAGGAALSPDGISWVDMPSPGNLVLTAYETVGGDEYAFALFNDQIKSIYYLSNGVWTKSALPVETRNMKFVNNSLVSMNGASCNLYQPGEIISGKSLGAPSIFDSGTGLGNVTGVTVSSKNMTVLAYGGESTTNPVYSIFYTDKIDWTSPTKPSWNIAKLPTTYKFIGDVIYVKSLDIFIAVGYGAVLYSSDGINWATATGTTPTDTYYSAVAYGNNIIVAGTSILLSNDGKTFAEKARFTKGDFGLGNPHIGFDGEKYILFSSSDVTKYSKDLVVWENISLGCGWCQYQKTVSPNDSYGFPVTSSSFCPPHGYSSTDWKLVTNPNNCCPYGFDDYYGVCYERPPKIIITTGTLSCGGSVAVSDTSKSPPVPLLKDGKQVYIGPSEPQYAVSVTEDSAKSPVYNFFNVVGVPATTAVNTYKYCKGTSWTVSGTGVDAPSNKQTVRTTYTVDLSTIKNNLDSMVDSVSLGGKTVVIDPQNKTCQWPPPEPF